MYGKLVATFKTLYYNCNTANNSYNLSEFSFVPHHLRILIKDKNREILRSYSYRSLVLGGINILLPIYGITNSKQYFDQTQLTSYSWHFC